MKYVSKLIGDESTHTADTMPIMISAAINGIAIKKKPSSRPPIAIRIAPIITTHRMISNGPTLLT